MLDGLFGTGNGSTSSSPNIGVLGITKVTRLAPMNIQCLIHHIYHSMYPMLDKKITAYINESFTCYVIQCINV